ncbi:thiol:disulfide interchange protein DsbA/DsbL [Luteimonas sp. e5]
MNTMKALRHLLFALFFTLLLPAGIGHAQGPALVEGRDYLVIEGGAPYAPVRGKIEVAEVFGYACPHCHRFEPLLAEWRRTLPADVNFVHVPATFNPRDAFARAYFAARQLRLPARTHDELFRAVHEARSMPPNPTEAELATFYSGYGVSEETFAEAMRSPEVERQMQHAHRFIQTADVPGTPVLIVAGRYLVRGRTHQDALRIASQLVAQSRAARR